MHCNWNMKSNVGNNVVIFRIKIYLPGFLEYKAEPVWYSALSASDVPYLNTFNCLSSLDLNILRVVAATVNSESEFQSCPILWLNTFLLQDHSGSVSVLSICYQL